MKKDNILNVFTHILQKNNVDPSNCTDEFLTTFLDYLLKHSSLDDDNRKCTFELEYTLPLEYRVKLHQIYSATKGHDPTSRTFENYFQHYIKTKLQQVIPEQINKDYNKLRSVD